VTDTHLNAPATNDDRVARRRAANRARIETRERERAAIIAYENAVCWCGHLRISHPAPYRGDEDEHLALPGDPAPCWRCAEGEWDRDGTFGGPCTPCLQFTWLMSPGRDDTELWQSLYRTDTLARHG